MVPYYFGGNSLMVVKTRLGLPGAPPRGSIVVPFGGPYLESYKVIPKRNYYGAYGQLPTLFRGVTIATSSCNLLGSAATGS